LGVSGEAGEGVFISSPREGEARQLGKVASSRRSTPEGRHPPTKPRLPYRDAMAGITVSIEINAPIERVWDRLSDLSSHSEWMQDAESIEFLTELREGVGTAIRVVTRVGPLRTADILEVTAWEPPSTLAVLHRGVVTGVGRFALTEIDTGTRFAWSETLSFPRWAGGPITGIAARPVLRSIWRRNLVRFRDRF